MVSHQKIPAISTYYFQCVTFYKPACRAALDHENLRYGQEYIYVKFRCNLCNRVTYALKPACRAGSQGYTYPQKRLHACNLVPPGCFVDLPALTSRSSYH